MAWSASGLFGVTLGQSMSGVSAMKLGAGSYGGGSAGTGPDTFKLALYNNSITPNYYDTAANSCYNAGAWANTNEVSQTTFWPAGGPTFDNATTFNGNTYAKATMTVSSSPIIWGLPNISQAGTTLSNIFGCLIYDNTVQLTAKGVALCAVYFGGTGYATSNGTFGITWAQVSSTNAVWTWGTP